MSSQGIAMLFHITVDFSDPVASLFPYGVDSNFPGRVFDSPLLPERESVDLSNLGINGGQVEQEINSKPDGVPGCLEVIGDIGGELRRSTDVLCPEIGLLPF